MSEDPTKLLKDDFDAIMKFLHRERDELRVKIHLAKAEAKEEMPAKDDKKQVKKEGFKKKAENIIAKITSPIKNLKKTSSQELALCTNNDGLFFAKIKSGFFNFSFKFFF